MYKIQYANANGVIDTLTDADVEQVLQYYGFTDAGLGIDDLRVQARAELVVPEDFEEYCRAFEVHNETPEEYDMCTKLGVLLVWLLSN